MKAEKDLLLTRLVLAGGEDPDATKDKDTCISSAGGDGGDKENGDTQR